jgi:periplasmic protein CpxP/Spy
MRFKPISFLVLAIALALSGAAVAQDNPQDAQTQPASPSAGQHHWRHGGHQSAEQRLNRMDQKLGLTADQKAKIGPMLEEQQKQAQAIRNDSSLTPEQKKAKFTELRQSTRSQIEALLTPEQRSKLAAGHEGGEGRGRMAANPEQRIDRLSQRLNLTDEQKSKLLPILQNQQSQMQSLRQDSSLTPEQRQEKAKQIRSETHKQVFSVLTPEQQKQLREGWQRHKRAGNPPQG